MIRARHKMLVTGLDSLSRPANRESGAKPERPRRGDRAQTGVTPLIAIVGLADEPVKPMRRLDTPARKSEDLPASIAADALRGTSAAPGKPLFSNQSTESLGGVPPQSVQRPTDHAAGEAADPPRLADPWPARAVPTRACERTPCVARRRKESRS